MPLIGNPQTDLHVRFRVSGRRRIRCERQLVRNFPRRVWLSLSQVRLRARR
ncbi:MAG: hypothetical protein ACYDGL_08895 [Bellilinea sp.]